MKNVISWLALGISALALVIVVAVVGGNNQPQILESDEQIGSVGTRFPNGLVSGSGSITASGDFVADSGTLAVVAANNNVGVGTTSPMTIGDVVVDGSATTTIAASTSSATKGGCIQLPGVNNIVSRIYVNAAGTALVVERGTCR